MAQRRPYSTKDTDGKTQRHRNQDSVKRDEHVGHAHQHEHSNLLHSHSHSHGPGEDHSHGVEQIMQAWRSSGDRGSRITLIGLFSNVGLTAAKGLAGWYMHSASLLADAGHSLSDLLGDFVTLFCWRLSRKPPSERYPYGFAKFETLGTTTVSLLLIGGALGIGFHSYHLLLSAMTETAATMPAGPLQEILFNVTTVAPPVPEVVVHHSHVEVVDPNAAWFAAVSILAKEWLYRITKAVADEENSPVLLANAIHHRSDAYSSLVALFAILGTWIFPKLPLDPIGGLLVSLVILRQGVGLLAGAWGDLTDAGVSAQTRQSLERIVKPLTLSDSGFPTLLRVSHIRGRRAGSLLYVDLVAEVSESLSVHDSSVLEEEITRILQRERREVAEVRVKFKPVSLES